MPITQTGKESVSKNISRRVLLMTTTPPENGAWYLGKRLPPIGLMYVAAALEKAGFVVQMLDNYLMKKSFQEVKELITTFDPAIVGITCGSATYTRCIETAKVIKQAKPEYAIIELGVGMHHICRYPLQHQK